MNPRPLIARLLPAVALVAAAACSSKPAKTASNADVTWDTLPNHAAHAVYASLPVIPLTTTTDLKIGGMGASGPAAFGDVRGIDVDSTGRILVLDGQANELRAFDAKGAPAGIVMKHGQGPSEIEGANGFHVDASGAIWVNDHGRWSVTRLKDGQFTTSPMAFKGYGFLWEGGVTQDGRVWDFARHAAAGADDLNPMAIKSGPQTYVLRLFLMSVDPKTGVTDSVALGTETRTGVAYGNGKMITVGTQIPFSARSLVAMDPAGAVWTAVSDVDRVVKLSPMGDTLLVIEMPGAGPDIAAAERNQVIARADSSLARARKAGMDASPDWDKLVPKRKPVLMSLSVDDHSRLWIERATLTRGPMFDVLTADGQLLGTVDPDFSPVENSPITIRGRSIYAVLKDSLDVPTVIRASVPFRPEQLTR